MTRKVEETSAQPKAERRRAARTVAAAAATNGSQTIPETEVARRAYELFCARGGEHGHDVEDWLRAENELRASTT